MNNATFQGKWKQLRGNIKTAFGKLTDDDLLQADSDVDRMQGILQEHYGYTKEKAQSEWHNFTQQHTDRLENAKADLTTAAIKITAAVEHLTDATKR